MYSGHVSRVAQSVQRLAMGWTVRGSNSGGGEIFRTCPDRPWGPPRLLYNGYRVFPGGKERPERDADPSLPSSAVVMKVQSYTSIPPMGRAACTEPQCLYNGALYLYLRNFILDKCCLNPITNFGHKPFGQTRLQAIPQYFKSISRDKHENSKETSFGYAVLKFFFYIQIILLEHLCF